MDAKKNKLTDNDLLVIKNHSKKNPQINIEPEYVNFNKKHNKEKENTLKSFNNHNYG